LAEQVKDYLLHLMTGRKLQWSMGHACISSTAAYLHLTQKNLGNTPNPLDLLDVSKRPLSSSTP
jgi:hypothetical protein